MKIAFAGGGTLGPVTPLLAVARVIKKRQPAASFIWFGTPEGPERALVEAEGITFHPITVAKLPRYPDLRWLTFPFDIRRAQNEARVILQKEKPDAIVSAGGFTAVPVVRAGAGMGIPCAMHQLDAVMGWSNRAIERYCVSKTSSFEREGYHHIPTPARFSAGTLPKRQSHQKPVVFVVGGGTGAVALNDAVTVKLDEWLAMADVIHATGAGKMGHLASKDGYLVRELFDQDGMKQALADADLVITRAGIGGLSDIASCKKAAIIVPIPSNQQEENAWRFKSAGAASVVEQRSGFAAELYCEAHRLIQEKETLAELGSKAQAFFPTDDGSALAEAVLKIV